MYLYVVIVFRNGYDASKGEVLGHYRTEMDAIEQGERACSESGEEEAVFNVYQATY